MGILLYASSTGVEKNDALIQGGLCTYSSYGGPMGKTNDHLLPLFNNIQESAVAIFSHTNDHQKNPFVEPKLNGILIASFHV